MTMSNIAQHPVQMASISNRQILAAVSASCLGWALDLFDLFVLLYVAPVIGKLFFPSTHAMLSLAAVYAAFAVTLLMRPIGSALFGSYADRHGRKGAMTVAVIGVGVSTALFGALPTVAQAGLAAPILFLMLRLIQGVFVGGVVASTHTIGTESVPPAWRGAVSGLIGGGGAGAGALLASLVYLLASSIFPGQAFEQWGWRCMFFTGIISSVLGLFVFSSLEESPMWKQLKSEATGTIAMTRVESPIATLFSSKWHGVLFVNLLITIGSGSGYYLTSGYLPSYLKLVNHAPNATTGVILALSSIGVIVAAVLAGHLSEIIGRKRAFIYIGLARLVLFPVIFLAMAHADGALEMGAYAVALSMLGTAGFAPTLIFLNERFPTAIRASGTGLSWNIGFAIGGMMPTFVSLTAHAASELPMTLAIFTVVISVILLIGAFMIPETKGRLDLAV
jgi:MFS transporter, MHS family, proline/betaine transporter